MCVRICGVYIEFVKSIFKEYDDDDNDKKKYSIYDVMMAENDFITLEQVYFSLYTRIRIIVNDELIHSFDLLIRVFLFFLI